MYAVIKTGGKQHKVQLGDVIEVERIVHEGETITFQPLLVVEDDGTTHAGPGASKAVVTATPLGEKKGDKVKIFKYRPKSGYARRQGHRQVLTMLEITGVALDGEPSKGTAKGSAKTAEPDAAEAKSPAKKSPAKKPAAKKTAAKKPASKKTTAKKTTAKKTSSSKRQDGET
jgi:large subunit ribosomal protein L21